MEDFDLEFSSDLEHRLNQMLKYHDDTEPPPEVMTDETRTELCHAYLDFLFELLVGVQSGKIVRFKKRNHYFHKFLDRNGFVKLAGCSTYELSAHFWRERKFFIEATYC